MDWKLLMAACLVPAACATEPVGSPDFPKTNWPSPTDDSAPYRVAPGDTLDVTFHTAPELNRTVKVAPDGQIHLPLIGAFPAATRTPQDIRRALIAAYSRELIEPIVDVSPVGFGGHSIFVGGAVTNPGQYALAGPTDPLQAIVLAGGLTREARSDQLILMRRADSGEVHSTLLDLRAGLQDPADATWLPLQRFDILYVPRTRIADQNRFVASYLRGALPFDFLLFYDLSE